MAAWVKVVFGSIDGKGKRAQTVDYYDMDDAAHRQIFRMNEHDLGLAVYSVTRSNGPPENYYEKSPTKKEATT